MTCLIHKNQFSWKLFLRLDSGIYTDCRKIIYPSKINSRQLTNINPVKIANIVRKGVPAPIFLRHPPLDPACLSLFKIFALLPSFLFYPLLRYFRQFSPPSRTHLHVTYSCPNSFDQPTFFGLKEHQMGDFTSSAVTFCQKSIFNILNPFTNRLS